MDAIAILLFGVLDILLFVQLLSIPHLPELRLVPIPLPMKSVQ